MPNVGQVLKSEITRLSKKTARQEVASIRSAASSQRKQLASLKKQVEQLKRELDALRRAASAIRQPPADEAAGGKHRFTAKGLKSLRSRLDLSAQDFGSLLGVGAQTIYNWESQKTSPRSAQVPVIAELRQIGKKEARARLDAASGN